MSQNSKQDFENCQAIDQIFFQPVNICSNPLKKFEKNLQNVQSSKSFLNILQPSQLSKSNIANSNNLSYSPNKFRDLNIKNDSKTSKRFHTENSVNDENICVQEQGQKENALNSNNKLTSGMQLNSVQSSLTENKAESLNESIYRYSDNAEDQTEALLEKDEEIQMLKAKRMADSIEIQYLKKMLTSVQYNSDSFEIIDQGENFTFYQLPSTTYDDNEQFEESDQENMDDLYINSCICRKIEKNCSQLNILDLESDIQKVKEDNHREKVLNDKRMLKLEGQYQIELMLHRSLETEKKSLISKLADFELKLEHQLASNKKFQDLIQKYQQEMVRLQEKLEFREYEINQLNEKKNVYQTKLKDYSEMNQEYKRRLEEKEKQLEDLKEKISEPIENINMVFTIVSNYKQTLAQFDEKIAELIQKQKVIDKLERQLSDKNEQVTILVKMGNQLQEKVNTLINQNAHQAMIIEDQNEKITQQQNISESQDKYINSTQDSDLNPQQEDESYEDLKETNQIQEQPEDKSDEAEQPKQDEKVQVFEENEETIIEFSQHTTLIKSEESAQEQIITVSEQSTEDQEQDISDEQIAIENEVEQNQQ